MKSTRYITPSLTVIPMVPQAIICGSTDPVENTSGAITESFDEEDFVW